MSLQHAQIVVDTPNACLWYYPDTKIIHHKFKQFMHGKEFRDFMTKAADTFIEKGSVKWLSDDRGNSALKQDDIQWGLENWTPRVMQGGWKYWALLMPDKALGKMNMRHLVEEYGKRGVTVEIFDDLEEAYAWLAGQ
ncbi:MAG TPA: hypothetical protein ENN69_03620 [Spirochaetia bacterium]|nr:hypothetical protein [Spirochaetia bacterium]